jgi:hypothetical protein
MENKKHSPALDTAAQSPFLKPRTLLFTTLALFWCFPSFGAAFILLSQAARWSEVHGLLGILRSVRVEEWVAFGLLAIHFILIWRAFRHYRNEPFPVQMNDGEELVPDQTISPQGRPDPGEFKIKE